MFFSVLSKSISYGTWHPSLARVSVTVSRGISIGTVGHSVPRETAMTNGTVKTQKRMELLPEEAIYLIERGSLLCWKESAVEYPNDGTFESISGSPMTVQQAYTEMIGKEDLTMDRYQVRQSVLLSAFDWLTRVQGLRVSEALGLHCDSYKTSYRILPAHRSVSTIAIDVDILLVMQFKNFRSLFVVYFDNFSYTLSRFLWLVEAIANTSVAQNG